GMLWNKEIDGFLTHCLSSQRPQTDPCIYTRNSDKTVIMLALYVDDILIAHNSHEEVDVIVSKIAEKYDVSDFGEPEKLLGMRVQVDYEKDFIALDQENYIRETLERFNMNDSNPVETPHSVGVHLTTDMCPTTEDERREMALKSYKE